MDVSKFESAGEWYEEAKKNGYSVPVQAGHILSTLTDKYGLSFREAYQRAIDEEGIILSDRTYFADMAYLTRLLNEKP